MLKNLLGILLFVNATFAMAQDLTFTTTVGMAVLCIDDVEPGFFYNYMTKIKPHSRREQGAYWFKSSEQLFGAPVTEVFVSDGSSRHSFIGIVSSLPPDQLAEAVTSRTRRGKFQKAQSRR